MNTCFVVQNICKVKKEERIHFRFQKKKLAFRSLLNAKKKKNEINHLIKDGKENKEFRCLLVQPKF